MQKIFNELQESDNITMKTRGIINLVKDENNNNKCESYSNSSLRNSKFWGICGKTVRSASCYNQNRRGGSNKEMIEKIYKLENELKDKEISLLQKNIHNEKVLE